MVKHLLQDDSFIRILFDTVPAWIVVTDVDRNIYVMNQAVRNFSGWTKDDELVKCGNLLNCAHCMEDPQGCGCGPHCQECVVRNTLLQAFQESGTARAKGKIECGSGKVLNVLVCASHFEFKEQRYVVIVIEDISLIAELEGLLPICAACKRIRDDQGYWNRVEAFIEKHSEAEFTHDICPECSQRLYPSLSGKRKDVMIV